MLLGLTARCNTDRFNTLLDYESNEQNFTLHFSAALLLIVLSLILPWTSKSNASDKNSSTGNRSSADNFTGICEVTGTIATIPEVTAQSIVTSL